MKIIDLSHPIDNMSPSYPNDSKIKLTTTKQYQTDGYLLTELTTNLHIGTHLDVASHLTSDTKLILDYKISTFIGTARVFNKVGVDQIDLTNDELNQINENDIVIIYTGFDKYYGQLKYYNNHPVITPDLAKSLVTRKIKLLVLDLPSPDFSPYEVHKTLFENNIMIVENTTNLKELLNYQEVTFYGVPLKIRAEASLIRAFAAVK